MERYDIRSIVVCSRTKVVRTFSTHITTTSRNVERQTTESWRVITRNITFTIIVTSNVATPVEYTT
ncbi:Uncharacterised protein [Vibrio cholerae]|nr:Uncharacterised protein [Vibrio cholerae]CSC31606.1 Uncharacterised protein [Vibrio cholerae]CSC80513.1 Uncharacterised protein [Vibrio cholerae]CSD60434.1 Uncharacterised protein [Vibrio cholerae]CSI74914.1 Uncharacterised protein [Vibrio cholerae]